MYDPIALVRHRILWRVVQGISLRRSEVPVEVQRALDLVLDEGWAVEDERGVVTPLPHPRSRGLAPEQAAGIAAGIREITSILDREFEVDAASWDSLADKPDVGLDKLATAYRWMRDDELIITVGRVTRATFPLPGQPKPEPKPAPPPPPPRHRPTVKLTAKPTPPPGDADDEKTLLRRLVHAAEVSAGLVAAPTRVRTPLGASPLLDTQLRICVVLAGAERPLLASEISRGHLTENQRLFLHAALADGVRRGGFTQTGGRGTGRRGGRYTLADPTVFDATWEAVNAAVTAQREAREARKVG